ncbi:hypothetical protein Nmel_013177 [Mimus melanotis]
MGTVEKKPGSPCWQEVMYFLGMGTRIQSCLLVSQSLGIEKPALLREEAAAVTDTQFDFFYATDSTEEPGSAQRACVLIPGCAQMAPESGIAAVVSHLHIIMGVLDPASVLQTPPCFGEHEWIPVFYVLSPPNPVTSSLFEEKQQCRGTKELQCEMENGSREKAILNLGLMGLWL